MAVANKLTTQQSEPKQVVAEYESNGEKIRLSASMVKQYLVAGNGAVSDEEVNMFISLCRYQHLNPFIREAYLVKYGDKSPATIITGKDVFTKRARRNKDYSGKQAGIIVIDNKTGVVTEREGTFHLPSEEIVGGWCKVYIAGHEQPEYASVSFEEYAGKTKDGELNSNWKSRPATMIRKVAVVHALREAFPEDYAGLYAQEEIPEVSDVTLDETSIKPEVVDVEIVEEPKKTAKAEPMNPPEEANPVQQTLFKEG